MGEKPTYRIREKTNWKEKIPFKLGLKAGLIAAAAAVLGSLLGAFI